MSELGRRLYYVSGVYMGKRGRDGVVDSKRLHPIRLPRPLRALIKVYTRSRASDSSGNAHLISEMESGLRVFASRGTFYQAGKIQ
jgi:hypothetical protein